ncbi:hypothetical protein ACIPPJ_31070 [Streptomyces sp. NPDC086091]|uniref:hypothetical protein n=1 Tax=Streptomyces sp. NPDC086091 TaxID=3365751 RepID=UPI00381D23F8
MSTSTSAHSTELASQYAAQVGADLERNAKEQERLSAEIAALTEQLTALRRDRAVLVNIQLALDVPATAADPAGAPEEAAPVEAAAQEVALPAPRGKATGRTRRTTAGAAAAAGKARASGSAGKAGAAAGKAARAGAAKKAAKPVKRAKPEKVKGAEAEAKAVGADGSGADAGAGSGSAEGAIVRRTLVDLVREHLVEQGEPRSAAEVTAALGGAHPGRAVRTTVVRTTLEGLVAKSLAHRTKQGSSVFYTAAGTTGRPAAAPDA